MNAPQSLPTVASVVFIRIADYTKRPVPEQARLRSRLESTLAVALQNVPARCRIPVDANTRLAVSRDFDCDEALRRLTDQSPKDRARLVRAPRHPGFLMRTLRDRELRTLNLMVLLAVAISLLIATY